VKDVDVLVELYKEQRQLGLHHEGQRNAATSIILTITSGLIAIIGFRKELTISELPVAFLIVFAGIFGAVLSLKHYERFGFHRHRSRLLRTAIDAALKHSDQEGETDCKIRDEIRTSLNLQRERSSDLLNAIVDKANESYGKPITRKGKPITRKPLLYRWQLHTLWAAINLFIAFIGAVLILMIISSRSTT
jgi:uncharacterized membrane protein YeaQ/YmgE (transglycosylase-associated protein family)